jgi:hypothetical protein
MKGGKHIHIGASLRYGWRLTVKHMHTLVPGTLIFYLPELLDRLGMPVEGYGWFKTGFKSLVGCWLLWHALQLSDQETRHSRIHEPTLPAPGYLGRFLASTALFWGGLVLALWPSLRVLSGTWRPSGMPAGLEWVAQPWGWSVDGALRLAGAGLLALPAALWSVYGWFHGYYVADAGQGAWPSMVSSYHSVRGIFWKTTGFLIIIAALNALGLALFFVGIFVAFPVTLMATTFVHLELKRQAQIDGPARSRKLPQTHKGG